MGKAREMIGQAKTRIYLALLPATFSALQPALEEAIRRGVRVVAYTTSDLDLPGGQVVVAHVSEETLGQAGGLGLVLVIEGEEVWWQGWALVGIYVVWSVANALILIPKNPELLIERVTRKKSDKAWDTVILSIVGLITIAKHIVAGFDVRWGWTARMPLALQIAALLVAVLGYALGTWAMAANPFFSMVYRIQKERGHTVATGGPYGLVRHPSYTGTIAFEFATPIILGSLWALIPAGLAALLFVVRTWLEDRALHEELDGYRDYAARVRYRLLPGIW
jgi:protein-S-isoprenylcysteine O-methyltransferase Ste14